MGQLLEKLKATPWIAHALEAAERFGERLGMQFAAAITYFSVLAIVPVLMVAFGALGFTITIVMPDALDQAKNWITETVSAQGGLGDQLTAVVEQAFTSWQAVGVVGLPAALWAGANWVNHIRSAVRAMMRPVFDLTQNKPNFVVQVLKNLGILLTLFLLVGVSMALTTAATTARDAVADFLGLAELPFAGPLLALVPVVGTLLAGFVLFLFLFRVLPERKVPRRPLLQAAVMGAVGMAALQYLTGIIVGVFSRNAAAAVFGSAIVVMLYFNLFATLILVVAAWLGTEPSSKPAEHSVSDVVPAHQPTNYAAKKVAAELAAAREREEQDRVPTEVAVRSTRVGIGLGAVVGGALAGLVALVAAVLSGLRGRG